MVRTIERLAQRCHYVDLASLQLATRNCAFQFHFKFKFKREFITYKIIEIHVNCKYNVNGVQLNIRVMKIN